MTSETMDRIEDGRVVNPVSLFRTREKKGRHKNILVKHIDVSTPIPVPAGRENQILEKLRRALTGGRRRNRTRSSESARIHSRSVGAMVGTAPGCTNVK
jgi:hypothetical protein